MLTVTRTAGEKIVIGDDIIVTVVSVGANGRVRIGIEAPLQVRIDRAEVLDRIRQENVDAAKSEPDAAAWSAYAARRANSRAKSPG